VTVADPDHWLRRRPRLAYPFTILAQPDTVRLVAGEDYRYTLADVGLDRWLPAFLHRLTGRDTLATLLASLPADYHAPALELVRQLYGERVLVDGPASAAHTARRHRMVARGDNALAAMLTFSTSSEAGELMVLCQDTLDYEVALRCNRDCRQRGVPWLWASTAALTRGYVSPLFLPDAGPCFGCLLRSFQRLSPAPELYDALQHHARAGGTFQPATFPADGVLALQSVIRWKLIQAEMEQPGAALYRLHVLDLEAMEIGTHRVFRDPECPDCSGGKL
jgi:bacteriocin biosynthesis cyclodehydratase domain-containing protein